jgi:hypothetical protein
MIVLLPSGLLTQPRLPMSFDRHQPQTSYIICTLYSPVRATFQLLRKSLLCTTRRSFTSMASSRTVRSCSALATSCITFIYKPFHIFICTLIRWLYGPKLPLFVYDEMSTKEIAPAAPLPLRRRRRLSIQEFTSPDPPRSISTYRQLFGKPAEVQHLLTRSSTSPETSTLLPRFHERLLGRHDVQCTAIQEKCPLLAKLPLAHHPLARSQPRTTTPFLTQSISVPSTSRLRSL